MNTQRSSTILHDTLETYSYPPNQFDIVTSRFVIHYISDILLLFKSVHKTLKDDGKFVFSIQHPLTTSSFLSKQTSDKRENWIVDDYFIEGERKEPWINKTVVKYHRTIEHYYTALTKSGFTVNNLREGMPMLEHFSNEEEFTRRLRIPILLAFSCTK